MRTKTKVSIILVMVVLIMTTVSISFAWFIDGILSDRFKFTVAYIDSQVTLYRGEDGNHDGNLDVDNEGKQVFTELGDSNSGSIKLDGNGNPIIVGGKPVYDKDVHIKLDINKILPTQIYTWKVKVQNIGDVKALLFAEIVIDVDVPAGIYGLDVMSVSVDKVNKKYFSLNYFDSKKQQIVQVMTGDELDYSQGFILNPNSIRDYIIQIEFESYDKLIAQGVKITKSEYQGYMGRVVTNVNMQVRLEDSRTAVTP